MKKLLTLVAVATLLFSCSESMIPEIEPTPEPSVLHNTEPYFSETVELMVLLWRLAGASEFSQCGVASVANSANSHFAHMKNHKAVTLAKQLRQQSGISYDAVTGYANQLIFNEEGDLIFDPDYEEGSNSSFDRWSKSRKQEMLVAVNNFYKVSNFHDWFVSTQPAQQQAITHFKSVCNLDYTWFDSFYGKDDKVSSRIILSFFVGGGNFGNSLKRLDGTWLLTPVLGSFSQSGGIIKFRGDINLIVHEFSHPYCNPLIDANWSAMSNSANIIFNEVRSIMNKAYGKSTTMMYETLVRSCAIHYLMTHNQTSLGNKYIAYDESQGFIMVRSIVEALRQREQKAHKYPTLSDFMPEIIDTINDFALNYDPK